MARRNTCARVGVRHVAGTWQARRQHGGYGSASARRQHEACAGPPTCVADAVRDAGNVSLTDPPVWLKPCVQCMLAFFPCRPLPTSKLPTDVPWDGILLTPLRRVVTGLCGWGRPTAAQVRSYWDGYGTVSLCEHCTPQAGGDAGAVLVLRDGVAVGDGRVGAQEV